MKKEQAANLKPGDKVRFKRKKRVYTVRKIAPFKFGLWTSVELAANPEPSGYLVYLEGVEVGFRNDQLMIVKEGL